MTLEPVYIGDGFVKLVDKMISPADLKVVNSARISMGKQTEKMKPRDDRLIEYLARENHTSPFRHTYMTFHIKAPIFVLRQWQKHQVGCSFNEISGRYVEFKLEYWKPTEWREQADNVKQGSGGDIVDMGMKKIVEDTYRECCDSAFDAYESLLALGVCREQARACLPLAIYSECYWTVSMQAVAHFLKLREDSHAQAEIRDYAQAVRYLIGEGIYGGEKVLGALNGER